MNEISANICAKGRLPGESAEFSGWLPSRVDAARALADGGYERVLSLSLARTGEACLDGNRR